MRWILAVSLFVGVAALAGSRAADSTAGTVPTLGTDGVSLLHSDGCRMSVRARDGGTINGGKLHVMYYDNVMSVDAGWVPASTAFDCTLESNKSPDGGAPASQVCPDLEILAKFGRIGIYSTGLVGADGGSPNGFLSDGGQSVTPITRIECWGAQIP